MTGLRRNLGLFVALVTLVSPALAARPDELSDTFQQGVELMRRGRNDEALKVFQKVLAMSPSKEAAYALWQATDYDVWRDMLVEGGEMEMVAKRLIELARVERKARRNDPAAIQKLVQESTTGEDAAARRKAVLTLSGEHGEYAVPALVPLLSGQGDEDRRVLAMYTLTQMNHDVVPPLVAALESKDPTVRRHIAMVLGTIGDKRAAGHVLWLSNSDPDDSVRAAAREAAQKMHASGDALSNFLSQGDAYHHGSDLALGASGASDVVWSWKDERLVATPVPRFLYNDEMAKRTYAHALMASPSSPDALAGLARAFVDEQARLDEAMKSGADVGEWKDLATEAHVAVPLAGVDALNTALQWSVESQDSVTAAALCRALAPLCKAPCSGLQSALNSDLGAVRSEAAVALGNIAAQSGSAASPEVVTALGEAAGREVMHLAALVDADASRAAALARALEERGIYASRWSNGVKGLTMLRRAPGLELILVADKLPDITTVEIIDEVKNDERLKSVPILVITSDAAATVELYGDKISGTVASASDTKVIEDAVTKELGGDRALANDLAARAGDTLVHLAQGGRTDLNPAVPHLVGTMNARSDTVAVPAMVVIGRVGGPGHAAELFAVLIDEQRSEEARVAAGSALADVLGRHPTGLAADAVEHLRALVGSQVSAPVREAASRALGLVQIDPRTRATILLGLGGRASE